MYSSHTATARINGRCYGFMESQSNNGIYRAESIQQQQNDTSDPLDLRLIKADEGTTYFADTNLLSDSRGIGREVIGRDVEAGQSYIGSAGNTSPTSRTRFCSEGVPAGMMDGFSSSAPSSRNASHHRSISLSSCLDAEGNGKHI